MRYKIHYIVDRADYYNPIEDFITYAFMLQKKKRDISSSKDLVITQYPQDNERYFSNISIWIDAYDGIPIDYDVSKRTIKKAIEEVEKSGLGVVSDYPYTDYYEYLLSDKYCEPGEERNPDDIQNLSFSRYLPFLINEKYISSTLKLEYEEQIREYIQRRSKVRVCSVSIC